MVVIIDQYLVIIYGINENIKDDHPIGYLTLIYIVNAIDWR